MSKKKQNSSKKAKGKNVDPTKKFFNPRVRAEQWDADYLSKLSKKELDWYKQFMNEYANASIRKDKKTGRPVKGSIHKKKEHLKKIYDANNKRNNDVFGVTKINNLLEFDITGMAMKRDVWHETDPNATESAMAELLDYKRNPEEAKQEYKKRLKK